ncbi:cation:proton antiporter [Streptacidiphilus sp. EB129]|uniref:cation:proton antiporter domain-containing protein n=1 Tax=Streptacidiphilus sp. EB129 TaxID=3156262 RepID=UPI0035171D8B
MPDALQATVIADIALVLVVGAVLVLLARRLRQPAVIAEITAGIVLGPSLLGLLPGDLPHRLFPNDARPFLSMVAQIGLLLFMFTVGWELDLASLRRDRKAVTAVATVTTGSMVLPFLLGLAVAGYCYQHHSTVAGHHVSFWSLALYLGVSMSITAFPVLARILTDNRLNTTKAGSLALASAALGDVLAWCLLAAIVAVVTASSQAAFISILWKSAGYVSVMVVLVRPALAWLVNRFAGRGTLPLGAMVTAALLLSAFATSRIGIHPIFGAFALGLAMPRQSRELLEDEVIKPLHHAGQVLLPVYFIVTGLSVNISGLTGTGWVELLLVLAAACGGKLIGATLPARRSGMSWRESMGVGVLMNTRGLTELIILNVGLSLHVLDTSMFTVMVLMALITTAMAGPVLPYLLPRGGLALTGRAKKPDTIVVRLRPARSLADTDLAG